MTCCIDLICTARQVYKRALRVTLLDQPIPSIQTPYSV